MKKISGYVLVRETGVGVPNLLVAAYDSDKTIDPGPAVRELGRRIGSVLTDQEGRFVLTAEGLEVQGDESRPDLTLVVFAPEDVLNPDEPYASPPERRILYLTTVPRRDAGAEEAFIIRLLQAQLDRFHISIGDCGKSAAASGDCLASAVESTWRFQDDLRGKLQPRLQEEQAKAEEFSRMAEEKVKRLSAIPRQLRDDEDGSNPLVNNRFLIRDEEELSEKLSGFQDAVNEDGLERMGAHRPKLRLRLTRLDLEELGLREEEGGRITGELDSEKLAEKMRAVMQGVDFVRVRGLDNPSPDELERKYLSGDGGQQHRKRG